MNKKEIHKSLLVSIIILSILVVIDSVIAFSGSGSGNPSTPFQIANCSQLQEIKINNTAYYELANDIDCSIYTPTPSFTSISLNGDFNGKNHTIDSLSIVGTSLFMALFGQVGPSARIRNVGLTNVDIAQAAPSGGSYVGAFVGWSDRGSLMENVYATGEVYGNSYYVGGLVGYGYINITNSYSKVNVIGNDQKIGGLVGFSRGAITHSYSTGEVGNNTAVTDIGGLIGGVGGGYVNNNSFWDNETSGQTTSAGGTGKTTAEMKKQTTFTNWDFNNIWYINEDNSYPYLRIEPLEVSLISPINNSHNNSLSITFTCNTTTKMESSNITLYVWNSTGNIVNNTETNSVIGTFNSTSFSINLPYSDYYSWNCFVYDGASSFASSNYTLDAGNLTRCRDLDENDEIYYLNEDLSATNNCLEIKISNVTLNGRGYNITSTSGSSIYINGDYDNLRVVDTILDGGIYAINIGSSASSNNSLINVTYTDVTEYISSGSNLLKKWYFNLNVSAKNTEDGGIIENANVTLWNVWKNQTIASNVTDSNGITIIYKELIEYVNNGGTKTYHSPYYIKASHDSFWESYYMPYNLISLTNVNDNLTITMNPVSGGFPSAAGGGPEIEIEKIVEVFIYENKTFCGDGICHSPENGFPTGNDAGTLENFFNCYQDCPGAIGEEFDEIIYSFTKYCFDRDPATICFIQTLFATVPGVGPPEELAVCGDRICEPTENVFSCSEDCGVFNMDTLYTYCVDDNPKTPCFFSSNISYLMLFGSFTLVFAFSFVKIKVPGERKRITPLSYVKLKVKKRRRWRR